LYRIIIKGSVVVVPPSQHAVSH